MADRRVNYELGDGASTGRVRRVVSVQVTSENGTETSTVLADELLDVVDELVLDFEVPHGVRDVDQ